MATTILDDATIVAANGTLPQPPTPISFFTGSFIDQVPGYTSAVFNGFTIRVTSNTPTTINDAIQHSALNTFISFNSATQAHTDGFAYDGTNVFGLIQAASPGQSVVVYANQPFSATSVKLDAGRIGLNGYTVTVKGFDSNGNPVNTQTISLDAIEGFQTSSLIGFNNIVLLDLIPTQGGAPSSIFFDDITVSTLPPPPNVTIRLAH